MMSTNKLLALDMAYNLHTMLQMALVDACRAAATRYGVDSDWIYRKLTD